MYKASPKERAFFLCEICGLETNMSSWLLKSPAGVRRMLLLSGVDGSNSYGFMTFGNLLVWIELASVSILNRDNPRVSLPVICSLVAISRRWVAKHVQGVDWHEVSHDLR